MAKVFVTQVPQRRVSDVFVPKVDLSPAYEHGEVVVMVPPSQPFFATQDLVRDLRQHLTRYDYYEGDCLMALGDPAIIAVAAALLGQMKGRFCLLKWDRELRKYLKTTIAV